ncbi:MAG: putative inorganic carbon transporter subunit DabA, partial [Antricoccus sp.]
MSLQIRTDVARVSRDIAPMWPLSSFIAINPLAAFEDAPFEEANVPEIALTRTLEAYVADLQSGRITHQDLIAAVIERAPALLTLTDITVADQVMSAAHIAAAELLIPNTSTTTLAPAPAPAASDIIDDLTVKWVAAFLDSHPLWPMPHREDGLYAAWRTLAAHDP